MKKIRLFILVAIFQSCVPSFAPEERIVNQLDDETVKLSWIRLVGTLDQHFPDYILLEKGNNKDTICTSYNVADIKLKSNSITIAFYGKPRLNPESAKIRNNIYSYEVKIDTTYRQ